MKTEIQSYNEKLSATDKEICDLLAKTIDNESTGAENKIWHSHPVWFIDDNPIVGYSKQKKGIRLMFWSGADFGDGNLKAGTRKFKDASIHYTSTEQVNLTDLKR